MRGLDNKSHDQIYWQSKQLKYLDQVMFSDLRYTIQLLNDYSLQQMRFLFIFSERSVPQWNSCYYDYSTNKNLILICKKAYAIHCNIEDLARQDNYNMQQLKSLNINYDVLNNIKNQYYLQILQVVDRTNYLFYKYHSISKRVAYLFFQLKIHELNFRLEKYDLWLDHVVETKHLVVDLLSNCYAETNKLTTMTQLHIQGYQRIHKKHQKVVKNFNLSSPSKRTARLARTILCLDTYRQKLNHKLVEHPEVIKEYNKFRFEEEVEPSPFKVSIQSYFFGLFNGFSFCVMITAFILLGINLDHHRPQDNDLIYKQVVFRNQYRLWKSLGFIVFYIWVFAISFYIFQKKRINYGLIFDYQTKQKTKSVERLSAATFLYIVWSCFFIFYVMDLIGVYDVANVSSNPQYPITIFFPIILFGLFLIFIVYQFVVVRRGALFFLFTLAKVIASTLGFYHISFGVIWITQQLTSLVQICADLVYSICYYCNILQTPNTLDNSCLSVIIIAQCITIFSYTIRLIQSLRIAYYDGKFIGTRQMYRVIRSCAYITLAALSLGSTTQNYGILWAWLALGVITSIYSIFVDVFLDWSLFVIEGKKIVKRREGIYPIKAIYFMIAYNIIARFSYVVSFSLKISFTYFSHPDIITTVTGAFELGRRLIWNLLRVQNQQLKNNYFLRVRTDYQQKQKQIIRQLKSLNKADIFKSNRLQVKRYETQFKNLRFFIDKKNQMRKQIMKFEKQADSKLQQIEDNAESQIFSLLGIKFN